MRSEQEDEADRRHVAIAIAIAAGVLGVCSNHQNIVLSIEGADIQDAYEHGERLLKNTKELKAFFKTRDQLMDSIRSAVAEHRTRRCSLCEPERPN